jgi:hypothetical protein
VVFGTHVFAGRIVTARGGVPVAGALVELNRSAVDSDTTTDADGRFVIDSLPLGLLFARISAPGYLEYRTKINLTESRSDATLAVISSAPPFSLAYYREFARGGFDGPLDVTRRWSVAPSFFLESVTRDSGEPVPAWILDAIERLIRNSVPELSAGQFEAAGFARGPRSPGGERGWVTVQFHRHTIYGGPNGGSIGGDATIGGNLGTVRIRYDPERDVEFGDMLGCGSSAVRVADHEIVHVMGFRHTSTVFEDFHSGFGCPGSGRPERVRVHAAVVYARPYGNSDIDRDPDPGSFAHSVAQTELSGPVVSCYANDFIR